jgi:hypothetical protein
MCLAEIWGMEALTQHSTVCEVAHYIFGNA